MSAYKPNRLEPPDVRGDLIGRLQAMTWPEPSPAARLRAWELLRPQLDAQAAEMGAAERGTSADGRAPRTEPVRELRERLLRRHDFAGQVCDGYAGALGARVSATRRLSRVRTP